MFKLKIILLLITFSIINNLTQSATIYESDNHSREQYVNNDKENNYNKIENKNNREEQGYQSATDIYNNNQINTYEYDSHESSSDAHDESTDHRPVNYASNNKNIYKLGKKKKEKTSKTDSAKITDFYENNEHYNHENNIFEKTTYSNSNNEYDNKDYINSYSNDQLETTPAYHDSYDSFENNKKSNDFYIETTTSHHSYESDKKKSDLTYKTSSYEKTKDDIYVDVVKPVQNYKKSDIKDYSNQVNSYNNENKNKIYETGVNKNVYNNVYNINDQCDYSIDLTALPDDCYKFRRCSNGILYIMNCPDGLVFDNRIKICNWSHDVPAPCGTQYTLYNQNY